VGYTLYQVRNVHLDKITFHDRKTTDWEFYKDILKVNLKVAPHYIHSIQDLELVVEGLHQSVLTS
jgi:hypothetical protein